MGMGLCLASYTSGSELGDVSEISSGTVARDEIRDHAHSPIVRWKERSETDKTAHGVVERNADFSTTALASYTPVTRV